jgi:hypothetical protein
MHFKKNDAPTKTQDYRTAFLLNTDYKILARIIANLLRPTPLGHFSGPWGGTILDAVARLRDATAYGELTDTIFYVLFLDFIPVFDEISYSQILQILELYECSANFVVLCSSCTKVDTKGVDDCILSRVLPH